MAPFTGNQRDEHITRLFDMLQANQQQDDLELENELFVPPVAQPGQEVEVLGDAVEGFIIVIRPVLH